MPKYYEGKEEDGRACSGIREDLKSCLLECPCVIKEGKSAKQCLKEGHCRGLLISMFECKRSLVLVITFIHRARISEESYHPNKIAHLTGSSRKDLLQIPSGNKFQLVGSRRRAFGIFCWK